ncbi:hypothetical protein D9Q98_009511 [Chlorella vulgaris]|uniref:Uncharacterized protein n=1 Tax=Chlorella vulgaris TaxID=3077 RepID=A0A9D4YSW8_CHLVU|nr:hypothetical protein D9Q98_009511 [Chlorella vulgaris]
MLALGLQLLLCSALVAGLQQPAVDLELSAAAGETITVANEQQLRAALAVGDLGWRDRRALHLNADIHLTTLLTISAPVRLHGACTDAAGSARPCVLSGTASSAGAGTPLLHISGPAALAQLSNLELVGGVGAGSLAGALTASNHSIAELVGVRLAGNTAAAGGGARVDTHAQLSLTRCFVEDNSAQQGGGGIFAHSGSLHLDRTTVQGNRAGEGAGISLSGGSRLTATGCSLGGNLLLGSSEGPEAGADLLVVDGDNSAAYLDPLPEHGEVSVRGGKLRRMSLLTDTSADADASRLHHVWDAQEAILPGKLPKQQQVRRQPQRQPAGQPTAEEAVQLKQRSKMSADERTVVDWMWRVGRAESSEIAVAAAAGRAQAKQKDEQPRSSRKLKQAYTVGVTTEKELADAISSKERYIRLDAHIGLTGAFKGLMSVLPPIKASVTITGNCNNQIFGGLCLLDAKSLDRIIHVDNSIFAPSFFVTFENIRFTGGSASGLGGAFFNQGRMQAEFNNCQFVGNSATNGAGAVSLADGAIGLFNKVLFQDNVAQFGAGGAAYLTSNAGFTLVEFQANTAPSGGAVAVGQSSSGIYFNGCTFNGNSADVFGSDVYMESWVATPAYFNPFPTSAQVYPSSVTVPYSSFTSWPALPLFTSPPPSPPSPPRPPPPSPPSPPNPATWVYTEDELWDALAAGNNTITLGAHIQMASGGRWWGGPPPSIIFPLTVVAQCAGFGSKCIIDMNGAPNPLFLIQQNALFSASNVRVLNGATMGNGGAVQVSGLIQGATFDSCDFMSNIATDGGAVNVQGSSKVVFSNCAFGVNVADNLGGAVKTVGANVTFARSTFYQNRAAQGGAIALGPMSNIVLITSNFSDNRASKTTPAEGAWGEDIFIAAPAGSSIALNQLPPESVAKIFPRSSNTLQYSVPPPMPSPPTINAPPFQRPPFPAPVAQPPARVRSSPPSPPNPPPRPPPGPPSPPLGIYTKGTPILWAPIAVGGLLLAFLVFFIVVLCCHRRILPKLEKPNELEKRLRGEYEPSDSEEEEMSVGDPTQSEIQVTLEGYYGTARFRRKEKAPRAASGPLSAGVSALPPAVQ